MRRRFLLLATIALAVPLFPAAASAQTEVVYPIEFPVQGDYRLTQSFGDPRGGGTRLHEGEDIMVPSKGQVVVAAADGVVRWIGTTCCYLAIEHDDGWETWYIHLNNDTYDPNTGTYTDDGLGWGIEVGIEEGTRVEAGQVIGYTGDSGNAEGSTPHLHFELRDPSGVALDPYPSLIAAELGTLAAPLCPEDAICDTVAFHASGGRFDLWSRLGLSPTIDSFLYGNPGDVAFSGDWDCDGEQTPGLYRRSDGYVYLRNSNSQGVADIAFFFGDPGDYPLAGDFDDDGCDTVSIYRPSDQEFHVINTLGSDDGGLGGAEFSFSFGNPGDKPFVGDFDGDGVDTVGLHRESTGLVYFRNANSTGTAESQFIYGDPGDKLVAADWDGDGTDTVGVYRPSSEEFFIKLSNAEGVADFTYPAGSYVGVIALHP